MLDRLANDRGIFTRLMVAGRRRALREAEGGGGRRAPQAPCVAAGELEIIGVARGLRRIMVDDDNLIGEIENEIALVLRARNPPANIVELKGEIIAEGAVEPE